VTSSSQELDDLQANASRGAGLSPAWLIMNAASPGKEFRRRYLKNTHHKKKKKKNKTRPVKQLQV
jgi:hypothetical protein